MTKPSAGTRYHLTHITRQQRRAAERAQRKALRRQSRSAAGALVAGAALGLCLAQPTYAADYEVTNLNDSGPGSLRQAIIDANVDSALDDITFKSGLSGTIVLTSGELLFNNGDLNIHGPGADVIAVSGNHASRVFNIDADIVTIEDLTIRDGNATDGGGIRHATAGDPLTLRRVVITDNQASGKGGGIYFEIGAFDIEDSRISGNVAGTNGGGIYIENTTGAMSILRTQITGNRATNGDGGGIFVYDNTDLMIEMCTISGNRAGQDGGGIFLSNRNQDIITILSSTISANRAGRDGGGIFIASLDDEFVTIENATISSNVAGDDGGGIYLADLQSRNRIRHTTIANNHAGDDGGGIYSQDSDEELLMRMTIIGDNSAGDFGPDAVIDLPPESNYNLIENLTGASIANDGSNVLGVDPQLNPLGMYGGPTLTHPLLPSSPALNAGDPAFVPPPEFDQRGDGFPRVLAGRIDIGAVEGALVNGATPMLGGIGMVFASMLLTLVGWLGLRRHTDYT